jgi:hypothetical protein
MLATLRKELERLQAAAHGRSPQAAATLAALRADRGLVLQIAGYDPEPRQEALLRSTAPNELLLTCRQFGKSTVGAALAVAETLLHPRALVLLVSPSLRQTAEIYTKCCSIYDSLHRPVAETRRTAGTLELANGSRLVSLPGSAATIRGFSRPRLIVADEAAFIADDIFIAVRPMLARSAGRMVMMSSPYGQRGTFFEAWTKGQNWRRTKVTASECPAIPPEFLESERRELGPRWFAQEYQCIFCATTDAVFDPVAVEATLERGARPLFLGGTAA